MTRRRPYDLLKRGLDVLVAVPLFVVSLPIQAGVAMAIAVKLGRPVFFLHGRPGKDGRVFTLIKFRTMLEPEKVAEDDDEARMTRFGRALRSTSLDELPSLINVIRGDMSMVGPRPLHVRYLDRYSPTQARRHEVRPGITGLAQVNGRNAISWERRLALDVEYVDRRSLQLDAWIVWKTVAVVLRREGIAEAGHPTKAEFLGPTGGNE